VPHIHYTKGNSLKNIQKLRTLTR